MKAVPLFSYSLPRKKSFFFWWIRVWEARTRLGVRHSWDTGKSIVLYPPKDFIFNQRLAVRYRFYICQENGCYIIIGSSTSFTLAHKFERATALGIDDSSVPVKCMGFRSIKRNKLWSNFSIDENPMMRLNVFPWKQLVLRWRKK